MATPRAANVVPESYISLQKRVKEEGIRVGSYSVLMKGVCVSLIGRDETRIRELEMVAEENIQGRL